MRTPLLLSVPLLALVVHASAQTTRTTGDNRFNVTITVSTACTLDSAQDLTFPSAFPIAGGQLTATGDIVVNCSATTPYNLGLDYGLHRGGGEVRNMQLNDGGTLIPYTLSQDSGHTKPWGNALGSWLVGTGGTGPNTHTVHARATLSGDEQAGTYTDTVTATLTF